jgi:hypothetical protein
MPHADLEHHAARGRVAAEMVGEVPAQPEPLEGIVDNGSRRLGAVACIPVGLADPVAEFSALLPGIELQADCA